MWWYFIFVRGFLMMVTTTHTWAHVWELILAFHHVNSKVVRMGRGRLYHGAGFAKATLIWSSLHTHQMSVRRTKNLQSENKCQSHAAVSSRAPSYWEGGGAAQWAPTWSLRKPEVFSRKLRVPLQTSSIPGDLRDVFNHALFSGDVSFTSEGWRGHHPLVSWVIPWGC